ncbi:helix-turn-helix domain-containing protein [Salipiger marinus]|jgi:transcriptional regulator with XRE-family HTH domain|uniref:helix-turn-helix domain-containing protein n=1 Tax=Salipiger marinus TaxID=555512 RepID=UPI002D0EE4DF|nr:helix-turn-helix transcriptional regulator [Salipiger manganoxidans]MEB3421921.1 helix-turn-helix transcriptional regulator [Salipiger manganoxidans]
MSDFSEKIRHVREEMKLSRRALGDLIGVAEGKIQKIEIGSQRADHEFLSHLSKETLIDLNWLLDDSQPILPGPLPRRGDQPVRRDLDRLRLSIEAVEEGLDAFGRVASPDIKAGLVAAAYELLQTEGEKAAAQIIRLVRTA